MRVETQRKLFAGVRIDSRMREQLEKCPQRDRIFFESTDSRYLTVLRGGDDTTYLGKVLDAATPLVSVDDVRRNVWSILQRICPGRRDEKEVKLFALAAVDATEPTFRGRLSGELGQLGQLGQPGDERGGTGGLGSGPRDAPRDADAEGDFRAKANPNPDTDAGGDNAGASGRVRTLDDTDDYY